MTIKYCMSCKRKQKQSEMKRTPITLIPIVIRFSKSSLLGMILGTWKYDVINEVTWRTWGRLHRSDVMNGESVKCDWLAVHNELRALCGVSWLRRVTTGVLRDLLLQDGRKQKPDEGNHFADDDDVVWGLHDFAYISRENIPWLQETENEGTGGVVLPKCLVARISRCRKNITRRNLRSGSELEVFSVRTFLGCFLTLVSSRMSSNKNRYMSTVFEISEMESTEKVVQKYKPFFWTSIDTGKPRGARQVQV